MQDSEAPEVTVVDRRQASQTSEGAATADPDTEASRHEHSPSAPSTETTSSGDSVDGEDEDTETDPFGMPDPAILVAMAGMQTTTPQFLTLLLPAIDSQARRALGLLADNRTGELNVDLSAAQVAIDTIQFLLGKLEAGLSVENHREMQRRLNDLRLNFVAKR